MKQLFRQNRNHSSLQPYIYIVNFLTFFSLAICRTHPGDLLSLKALKHGFHPNSVKPWSCLSSWDFSLDPCDNIYTSHFTCGFRCDFTDLAGYHRVTEITLDSANYTGSLSYTNWNFPYLQTLQLPDNSLAGSLPKSLSNLIRLRRLSLSNNLFSLHIPDSLGSLSQLEEIYLDNNRLIGPIPSSFNNLKRLKRLELQQNRLSGEFPFLGSIRNLIYLDVSYNRFGSEFPSSLPISLVSLSMRNSSLKGELPRNFDKIKYLEVVDLSNNDLSGQIPSQLFEHPSLQQLTLSYNQLSSIEAPTHKMGINNSALIAIDFSNNRIGGLLPSFIAALPELSALSLENNQFTGMIPSAYAKKAAAAAAVGSEGYGIAPFHRLLLGGNYLFGLIPGPLLGLKPGSANVSLVDNCLYKCPDVLFFCQGAHQKPLVECKRFRPSIVVVD